MEKLYLIKCIYENEHQRVITYFSKDPYIKKYDFTFKEKYNPFFYIDIPKEVALKILSDFKKEIRIEKDANQLKIIAKDKEILNKCYKILSLSTSKKILLIEPERQYLIEKSWNYYDLFLIISRTKIKKIEVNNLGNIVKKYINPFLKEEQIKIIESLTRKILLSNILKIEPTNRINNSEIMNILFENLFFENKLIFQNQSKINYLTKESVNNKNYKIDFSNIWPYFLTKEFYNIGQDTLNCDCCIPKNYIDTNVLAYSFIKVEFKKDGFYFISIDKDWAYKYHLENKLKENRQNYKKNNYLKEMPVGPFFKKDIFKIPLIDSINLLKENEIEIKEFKIKDINWYCLKKESYISKIISYLLKRLKTIELSINLSTSITYSSSLKNTYNLEKNTYFIQYLTEYKLINDLIEEIPKFIEHTNTKFYSPDLSKIIKHIKYETIKKIDINNKYLIENQKIVINEKKFIEKINNYFPKINLPIPKLIIN